MTEDERLDREVLLKRAAAAAGAMYLAPALTGSARAEIQPKNCSCFACETHADCQTNPEPDNACRFCCPKGTPMELFCQEDLEACYRPSEWRLFTALSGAEEVPPGDSDGRGAVAIQLDVKRGRVSWWFGVQEIQIATAAHIHRAPMGANGPIVLDMSPTARAADDGVWEGSREGVRKGLIRNILRTPTDYYVNVHNTEFPDGAIRGQLGD